MDLDGFNLPWARIIRAADAIMNAFEHSDPTEPQGFAGCPPPMGGTKWSRSTSVKRAQAFEVKCSMW